MTTMQGVSAARAMAAPRPLPSMRDVAQVGGQQGGGSFSYAPQNSFKMLSGGGADMDEVQSLVESTIRRHEERLASDLRALMHD